MKMFSSTEIDEILKLPILQQFERQKVEHYDVTLGPDYKLVFPCFKPENWTVKIVSWDRETYAVTVHSKWLTIIEQEFTSPEILIEPLLLKMLSFSLRTGLTPMKGKSKKSQRRKKN